MRFKTNIVDRHHRSGFTIVEMLAVIVIIGILATTVIFAIGSWRQRTAQTEVKNDLNAVSAGMESIRNFGAGYPSTLPGGFKPSVNVTVTYTSGDLTNYCIDGKSKVVTTVTYFINTNTGGNIPQKGTCALGPMP
ncbi:MAG: type II secretion system protein [Candidatus Saccharimonadales bacterium]